jgi:hypothetical protein
MGSDFAENKRKRTSYFMSLIDSKSIPGFRVNF